MLNAISYIATVLSLAGNLMVARKSKYAFPVWIVSNILWILVNILGYYNTAQVIMYAVYTVMNTYGWINWRKEYKNEE